MISNLDDILSAQGPIARRLGDRFEVRSQQLQMIHMVDHVMEKGGICMVEAGTGVGKSFAYLLPAVKRLGLSEQSDSNGSGRSRIVVATHTIALQEQLMEKDIPLLQSVLGEEFSAVLVKGRGNYLSLRRMKRAMGRQGDLFEHPQQAETLEQIHHWSQKTSDGSLASLPVLARSEVWTHVQSDSEDCMGRRCPTYGKCFYQAARRRMEHADLLVVNHALFFADMAMKQEGFGVLPPYDHVILDEAHNIEDVAADYFGLSLSRYQVHLLLTGLVHARKGKGLLVSLQRKQADSLPGLLKAMDRVASARVAMEQLFEDLITWQETSGRRNGRVHEPRIVDNPLGPILADLAGYLKMVRDHLEDEDDRLEVSSFVTRCQSIGQTLAALWDQTLPGSVYWLQVNTQHPIPRVRWIGAPIEVGPLLAEHLFARKTPQGNPVSVTLTSATLATATLVTGTSGRAADPFDHFASRVGVPDKAETLLLGSPFDYATQARLFIETRLPDPNAPDYADKLSPRILHHLDQTQGGAFVLFTSFKLLEQVAHWLEPFLKLRSMPMLVHGKGVQRSQLLARFRQNPNSVLLGADSFWQGVDVLGDGLRNVIITRLPFARPDHPLTEARMEQIQAQGHSPFRRYSLPQALLRFKQGFGRLIRSRRDHGRVVVLDHRIKTRSYGRQFLEALPPLPIEVDVASSVTKAEALRVDRAPVSGSCHDGKGIDAD